MHRLSIFPVMFCASILLVLGLVASRASADTGDPTASTIRVTGQASVTSRPDRVELDLGVVTRAPSSQAAATENARMLQGVVASLQRVVGPRATVETVSYALEPAYQYPQQGAPRIIGYTATNVVRVTEDDLTTIGAVIDTATRAGANQIERIRFTLKDESAAKVNALRIAALDARAKANSLASSLGLQIVRVHSVEEATPTVRPLYDLALRAAASTTPILPGTLETSATVTLAVDFGNRR